MWRVATQSSTPAKIQDTELFQLNGFSISFLNTPGLWDVRLIVIFLFYFIYFLGHFCLVPGSIKAMKLLCGYHANTNLHLFREIAHCFLGDKSPKRLLYKWSCFRCNRANALLPSFISQSVCYAWTRLHLFQLLCREMINRKISELDRQHLNSIALRHQCVLRCVTLSTWNTLKWRTNGEKEVLYSHKA